MLWFQLVMVTDGAVGQDRSAIVRLKEAETKAALGDSQMEAAAVCGLRSSAGKLEKFTKCCDAGFEALRARHAREDPRQRYRHAEMGSDRPEPCRHYRLSGRRWS